MIKIMCSVPGCNNGAWADGLCSHHWGEMMKNSITSETESSRPKPETSDIKNRHRLTSQHKNRGFRNMYNHYVSVIVNGQLIGWTGRNPEKYPEDRKKALDIAALYRNSGDSAYAVEIREILEDSV